MTESSQKMEELKVISEKLVKSFFEMNGSIVEYSEDTFDIHKDLIVDGVHTEVKCEVPFHHCNAFNKSPWNEPVQPAFTIPFKPTQMNKMYNVPRLIFVQRPGPKRDWIELFEAPKVGYREFSIMTVKHGQTFCIRKSDLKSIGRMERHASNGPLFAKLMGDK